MKQSIDAMESTKTVNCGPYAGTLKAMKNDLHVVELKNLKD